MPPKKASAWKSKSRKLVRTHGIKFLGPVKPSEWPKHHKHTFSKIRDIGRIRHDDKCVINRSGKRTWRQRQDTIDLISKEVRRCHGIKSNEESWRAIEPDVLRIFKTTAICQYCNDERYEIRYQAEPLDKQAAERLKKRRLNREWCHCNDTIAVDKPQRQHDAVDPLVPFASMLNIPMTHMPEDEDGVIAELIENGVPMKPDRTIALNASHEWLEALQTGPAVEHTPMEDTNMVYPFLVLEAKGSSSSPGWAAIEEQSAFPIRRLLFLQNALYTRAKTDFHPLVWFFATQGEDWRVHGATLDGNKVFVYNLWQGNTACVDSIEQLLEIVDYIWSWARDVYRSQIRTSLCFNTPGVRALSPVTEAASSQLQSAPPGGHSETPTGSQFDLIVGYNRDAQPHSLTSQPDIPTLEYETMSFENSSPFYQHEG